MKLNIILLITIKDYKLCIIINISQFNTKFNFIMCKKKTALNINETLMEEIIFNYRDYN